MSDGRRIFGVETEFGTLVADPSLGSPESAVEMIKDYLFFDLRLGAIDLHARDDVFEPAASGGFLLNGAPPYIYAGGTHPEDGTAECTQLKDLVANDRAGQRQIVRAIKELELEDMVSVYNNSVDHFGGHTFGCHENYLVRDDGDLLGSRLQLLYPFLVTRQIFAGVGRVGGHILYVDERGPNYEDVRQNPIDYIWVSHIYHVAADDGVKFQLSQRADHILKTVASRVRFNRALINPKWETMYSHSGMTRLHMLFGEANQNEFAYALKVGTTALVLRLLEDDVIPPTLCLANPLQALRDVSRDPEFKWTVQLAGGETIGAADLQRQYLKIAQRYRASDEQTDWVLNEWETILDDLERDPLNCADRVDWVAKFDVVKQFMESEGLEWDDDALHSVDLEYHNIDPSQSLFHALQEMGKTRRVVDDLDIVTAMTDPPRDTRAFGRSKLVDLVLKRKSRSPYAFDWNGVAVDRNRFVSLDDPFDPYEQVLDQWGNEV